MTKKELKELIRECIREELAAQKEVQEGLGDVLRGLFTSRSDKHDPSRYYCVMCGEDLGYEKPLSVEFGRGPVCDACNWKN